MMKFIFLAGLLFALTMKAAGQAPNNSVLQLPASSDRWALIVGIGKYEDPNLNPLFGPDDATALANDLEKYAGFPHDHIVVLSDDQPIDRQPKRERVLYWLSNIKQNASSKSLVLFAFSGHGISVGGKSYLLAIDTHLNYDRDYLEQNAISSTDIANSFRDSQAKQIILLLDACRNDPYSSKGNSSNPLTQQFADSFDFEKVNIDKEAYATLYATSVGKEAFQNQEAKMGYFTWVLDQAFKGIAYETGDGSVDPYDSRGRMTLARLVKYVQDRTPAVVKVDHPNESQVPYAIVEGFEANQLIFAKEPIKPNPQPNPEPANLHCNGGSAGSYRILGPTVTYVDKPVPDSLQSFPIRAAGCHPHCKPDEGDWIQVSIKVTPPNSIVKVAYIGCNTGQGSQGNPCEFDAFPPPVRATDQEWIARVETRSAAVVAKYVVTAVVPAVQKGSSVLASGEMTWGRSFPVQLQDDQTLSIASIFGEFELTRKALQQGVQPKWIQQSVPAQLAASGSIFNLEPVDPNCPANQ